MPAWGQIQAFSGLDMMKTSISTVTYGVISVLVIVLLIATVAIPVIENAQTETRTTELNTSERFTLATGNEGTIAISATASNVTVGSYVIDNTSVVGARLIAFADDFMIYNASTQSALALASTYNGGTFSGSNSTISIDVANKTVTYGTTTIPYTGNLIYADDKGKLGSFKIDSANVLKFNKDSVLYSWVGSSTITNADLDPSSISFYGLFKGKYNDIKPVFSFTTTASTTIDSVSVEMTPVVTHDDEDYLSTSTSTKVNTSITTTVGTYTNTSNWNHVIAPLEYKYISDSDGAIISLLSIIPLIMCIIPIMICVGFMTTRRD